VPKMRAVARRKDPLLGRVVRLKVKVGDDRLGMWLDFGEFSTCDLVEPNPMLGLVLDPA
jgi:hypothetical protein